MVLDVVRPPANNQNLSSQKKAVTDLQCLTAMEWNQEWWGEPMLAAGTSIIVSSTCSSSQRPFVSAVAFWTIPDSEPNLACSVWNLGTAMQYCAVSQQQGGYQSYTVVVRHRLVSCAWRAPSGVGIRLRQPDVRRLKGSCHTHCVFLSWADRYYVSMARNYT